MTGRLQETLEETQRRLALGGVTTAPMLQTRDTVPRPRVTAGRVILVVVLVAVASLVGLFVLGLAVG